MKRLTVFTPTLCLCMALAAWPAFLSPHAWSGWTFSQKMTVWIWIMSGPFQHCWREEGPNRQLVITGIVLLAGMLAHPVRPNFFTVVVTVLSFLVWIVFGVMYTFVGV